MSLIILGCDDILDLAPQDTLTEEAFYQTAEDAVIAVNAAYDPFQNLFYYGFAYPILGNLASGDAMKGGFGSGDQAAMLQFQDFSSDASNGRLNDYWKAIWPGVLRANVVLEKVPEIDMDESLKNRVLGEAKFIRALNYYNLTMTWGDLPIYDFVPTATTESLPRSPKSEVVAFIEQDLKDAINLLPDASDYAPADVGRASKGSAQGLLARLYANLGRWPEASGIVDDIMKSPMGYDLAADYANNFNGEGDNNIETLFEIQYNTGTSPDQWSDNGQWNGNQIADTWGPIGTAEDAIFGWGFSAPTEELVTSYEAGDLRLPATVLQPGDEFLGDTFDPENSGHFDNTGSMYGNVKYINPGASGPGTLDSPVNFKIIRFAEMLLIKAEALNEGSNDQQNAVMYLDMVRERAGLDGIEATLGYLPGQAELREIIYNEMRIELALEGTTFFNFVSRGLGSNMYGDRGFQAGQDELFPIPQGALDINGWSPNPGY
ncbi:RagB/SusD family nutrient uptake outer membrane protein [Aestuariibaculum sediminum]|uniref:RagB/SusD family nutrient uptake outer membrane protein n=1 Tax=Aestuariibaculum sediminum TaxID=2770637 RepID=A0A8J6QLE4_9FLAO|nr:RagB/SusD family nutrient uptake outer membrane protein [Aestuariibaculum sediminum]MBD0833409.1 RagB/SusD family nutrient uptake outer membrane protein [Aestuariibaculum sediminum]